MALRNDGLKHTGKFATLADACNRWGGQLIRLDREQFEAKFGFSRRAYRRTLSEAPFTSGLGCSWSKKIIYYSTCTWAEVIHEMGHVFACKNSPDSSSCEEMDFFAWEFSVAKNIVGSIRPWIKSNAAYMVSCPDRGLSEFGTLPYRDKISLIVSLVPAAVSKGLLDNNLMPLPLR